MASNVTQEFCGLMKQLIVAMESTREFARAHPNDFAGVRDLDSEPTSLMDNRINPLLWECVGRGFIPLLASQLVTLYREVERTNCEISRESVARILGLRFH